MYDTLYFLPFEIFLKIIWKLVILKPQVRLSVKQNFGLGTYRPTCLIRCTRFHEPRPILKPQAWIPKANHVHRVTPTDTIKPTQSTQHNAMWTETSLMTRLYKQSQYTASPKKTAHMHITRREKKCLGTPVPHTLDGICRGQAKQPPMETQRECAAAGSKPQQKNWLVDI